ncbi:MAG: peptidoglycan-associated lipoprotein Pal [Thermoanaerobaculia bacterium]
MKRSVVSLLAILALSGVMLVAGCKKKRPSTTDTGMETETTETPAEEVTAPPEVDTMSDLERAILDEDLQRLNQLLAEQGLVGDVYFNYDDYDLQPEARERLSRNAEFLKAHPDLVFTIEGHCDERGTNEYNLALGDRRANAAKNYLLSLGVGASAMQTLSYGEERQVCTDAAESCWSRNRRAHFLATGKSS